VFVLYTREDAFGLIADSEDKLNAWLKSLKIEQKKDEVLNASGRFQRPISHNGDHSFSIKLK